ncbi:MAG: hydrogenase iron-sulfur subunit [bacterium]|nr:hydrogenase iron-sulfur subunit [bacterium]
MEEKREPKIVGFLCKWCTSAAADLAGTSRMQYPPSIRPIKVMCSGSVDMSYILRALLMGADGVLVGGCHPADCHYLSGNYKARRRIAILKSIFDTLDLDSERIELKWISASEGKKFADTVKEFNDKLSEKGPNDFTKSWNL